MKKVISIIGAVAMLLSMTVASADANNTLVFTEKDKTENSVKVDVSLTTEFSDIQSIAYYLDVADIIDNGGNVTVTNGAAKFNYVAAQKMVAIAFAPTDGSKYTSGAVLGTINVTGLAKNFTIGYKPVTNKTKPKVSRAGGVEVTSSVTAESCAVTMAAADKFEAKLNDNVITFEHADLSTANKEIGGKAIKIFGKTYTVNAKSKFVISAKGESKEFGKTAAEYLGLEGDGEATGNVTIGIIYDKAQYSADDFEISAQ
jgi:hypothetical protein